MFKPLVFSMAILGGTAIIAFDQIMPFPAPQAAQLSPAEECLIEADRAAAGAAAIEPQHDATTASRIGSAIVRRHDRKQALKSCLERVNASVRIKRPIATPLSKFRDCADCPEMLVVPTGSFMAGPRDGEISESGRTFERKKITFERPFAIGTHEVTVGEYLACVQDASCILPKMNEGPMLSIEYRKTFEYRTPAGTVRRWSFRDLPYKDLSQVEAKAYAAWLSGKTGRHYRLPSATEWEYAARAGSVTRLPWAGDDTRGHATLPADPPSFVRPLSTGPFEYPVAIFPPNAWGLFDVIGGVGELTADCLGPYSADSLPADGSALKREPCARITVRGDPDRKQQGLGLWSGRFSDNQARLTGVRIAASL